MKYREDNIKGFREFNNWSSFTITIDGKDYTCIADYHTKKIETAYENKEELEQWFFTA